MKEKYELDIVLTFCQTYVNVGMANMMNRPLKKILGIVLRYGNTYYSNSHNNNKTEII